MMLKENIVLVTGAGRGIGRAISLECAREGAVVILVARTESELNETLGMVQQRSQRSFYSVIDITEEHGVGLLVDDVVSRFGRIDALVNNAGVQPPIGPFFENSLRDWWRAVEVNLLGTTTMIKSVLPNMMARGRGKIVNLSGGGATSPRENFSAYGVSKTAIVRLTETLARELRAFNIQVNAVAPGAINTQMLKEVLEAGASAGKEHQEASERERSGGDDPQVSAELVAYLISGESDGVTGKLISAKWDPWKDNSFRDLLKSDSDFATLRRIDLRSYYKK